MSSYKPKTGDIVTLTEGTSLLAGQGERHTVTGDETLYDINDVYCVEHVNPVSHSSLTGGGRDYTLHNDETGQTVRVRTTTRRPADETFVPA